MIPARDLGARGDGATDDTDALRRALDAAAARGGPATVALDAGVFLLRPGAALRPAPGTALAGVPGRTTLRFGGTPSGAAGADGFGVGLLVDGADITVDGLVLERAADADSVLVRLGRTDRATLSRLVLLGHAEAYARPCHGVQVGTASGVSTGLRLLDSVVSACDYGLFQANESTAISVGVEVGGCTFARNAASDLEFNSPSGSFRGVRVDRCTFRDNDSEGFAVGVAYGADVAITGSTMSRYRMEAVHVEDYSSDVLVAGNTMTACGLAEFAHVQVISGASGVVVRGNRLDASASTAPIAVVSALPGGSGRTAGGRAVVAPREVTVVDNDIVCSTAARAVAFDGVVGGAVTGNRVSGPGAGPGALVLRGTSGVTAAGNAGL